MEMPHWILSETVQDQISDSKLVSRIRLKQLVKFISKAT